MPRGVAWIIDSRYTREGSGVAPGAKTFFGVFAGRFILGEKGVTEGLSLAVEALKILRDVEIEFLFRLLAGISSRVFNSLRAGAERGVPSRLLAYGVET